MAHIELWDRPEWKCSNPNCTNPVTHRCSKTRKISVASDANDGRGRTKNYVRFFCEVHAEKFCKDNGIQ